MIYKAAIQEGDIIYTGYRHHLILKSMPKPTVAQKRARVQGFITEDGMFFTREQAAIRAFAKGQIPSKKKRLFSEDIWPNYKEFPQRDNGSFNSHECIDTKYLP